MKAFAMDGIRTSLEQMLRGVCPDLDGVPLYIVGDRELPKSFKGGSAQGAIGLTSRYLDCVLEPYVDWQGRGAAVLINDGYIAKQAKSTATQWNRPAEQVWRSVVDAIVVHEVSHVVDREFYGRESVDVGTVAEVGELVAAAMQSNASESHRADRDHHDAGFIRCLIHLADRIAGAGFPICWASVASLHLYGLSPLFKYIDALDDEPTRLHRLSFADMKRITPPHAFTSLWERDCIAREQRTKQTKQRAAHVARPQNAQTAIAKGA